MPFPVNMKGTPKSATAFTRFWNACSVYTDTYAQDKSLKVVKYSTRESGHDQKKRSPPLFCSDVKFGSQQVLLYGHLGKYTRKRQARSNKEKTKYREVREKKNYIEYSGDLSPVVAQGQGKCMHMRGNMRLTLAPNRFNGQTNTNTHKDRREFSAKVSSPRKAQRLKTPQSQRST